MSQVGFLKKKKGFMSKKKEKDILKFVFLPSNLFSSIKS